MGISVGARRLLNSFRLHLRPRHSHLAVLWQLRTTGARIISNQEHLRASFIGENPESANPIPYRVSVAQNHLHFPEYFDTGEITQRVISQLVQQNGIKKVVETGVANGRSTTLFLSALSVKGEGTLISFDIEAKARESVNSAELAKFWDFRVIEGKRISNRKKHFKSLCSDLNDVDIWYHDSDHSYAWQSMEYELAWKKIKPGGYLISDDVDWSFAWLDFIKSRKSSEIGMNFTFVDGGKVSALIQKQI